VAAAAVGANREPCIRAFSAACREQLSPSLKATYNYLFPIFVSPEIQAMNTDASRDKLITDVKTLMADADDIVKAMASATGEKATELGEKLRIKLRSAKEKMGDVQEVVADRAKAAARATDDFVHDNPWKAIGIAAGVGFLLGLLVNRK